MKNFIKITKDQAVWCQTFGSTPKQPTEHQESTQHSTSNSENKINTHMIMEKYPEAMYSPLSARL